MQPNLGDAPIILFYFTDEGRLMGANNRVCQIVDSTHEELVHKNVNDIVTLATRIFFQTHFFPLLRLHGHAEEIYITLRSKKGDEVPVIINVNSVAPNQYCAAGITIINRNKYENEIIAAKKYAEKALAENKELLQAKTQLQLHATELDRRLVLLQQQNENLQQLSFSLAHTVQEPLRKIALFSSMLVEEGTTNMNMLQKLNKLAIHTKQLFMQLQEYLQIGLHEGEPEKLVLGPIVEQAAANFKSQGHTIDLKIAESPLLVGYPKLLRQLFYQLLQNAVQFKQKNNPAEILIESVVIKANSFRMLSKNYSYTEFLKVSVRDKGIGFSDAQSQQIFGLFTKVNPAGEGYGMGLPLSKKIMELHNGYITAEGVEDSGAIISCLFPLPAE